MTSDDERKLLIGGLLFPVALYVLGHVFQPVEAFYNDLALIIFHHNPPEVLQGITCESDTDCKAQNAAFTAILQKQFPPGTPVQTLKSTLEDETFTDLGQNAMEYFQKSWSCDRDIIVEWSEENGRITKVNGIYGLICR